MANNKLIATAACGVAALLTLISLFTGWWTGTVEGGGLETSNSAGPFDSGDSDDLSGKTTMTGILVVVALVALIAATVLMGMGIAGTNTPVTPFASWIALGASVLIALTLVLAVFTWPEGDTSFWDSEELLGVKATTGAGVGWYLALAAVVVGVVGGVYAMGRPTAAMGGAQSRTA